MPTSITRRLEFDAGHRVWGHEGKCNHLHGHRYAVEITVTSDLLDKVGRVVDFSVIKARVGTWIDDNWDHRLLLNSADPLAALLHSDDARPCRAGAPFLFSAVNPTAEVIARHLFHVCEKLLPEFTITNVVCRETPNCAATYPA